MEIITLKQNKNTISLIVKNLQKGKVLVVPTDTVYGLVCDAANEKAVEKIFEIKKRDIAKPLLVFVKDTKMAGEYAVVGAEQKEFLKKNWPGAVTVILKARLRQASARQAKKGLSKLVYKNDTIGLRQPGYKLLAQVLKDFNKPLAQTSANISGQPATTKINEVLKQFVGQSVRPDIIIDAGDILENKPSKIVEFTTNKLNIIRP